MPLDAASTRRRRRNVYSTRPGAVDGIRQRGHPVSVIRTNPIGTLRLAPARKVQPRPGRSRRPSARTRRISRRREPWSWRLGMERRRCRGCSEGRSERSGLVGRRLVTTLCSDRFDQSEKHRRSASSMISSGDGGCSRVSRNLGSG